MKKVCIGLMVVAVAFALVSMTAGQGPWEVPAKYKSMANPVKADDASVQAGAMLYKKNCASCHGKVGLGDGVKSRTLETFPGDFTVEGFQSQTDGEHFYKTKFGRGEMPKYDKKIPDEDIWHMINYMRTFKK
jgi:mono/diheme cytochrome c family protein